jgi:RNA polymerase sigma factor (sigma-70 family)
MSHIALPALHTPELTFAGPLSSDERLAALIARGHEGAFAVLYRRHHQALYRYCRAILHDDEDASEALQSTMEHALAALRTSSREVAVRPWLFRIAHNESISILRGRRTRTTVAGKLAAERAGAEGLDAQATLERREQLAALVADLRALSERQRSALVMRELSGLGMEQIGAALSTSSGAAKQLLFEARSALHDFAEGRAMECEHVRRAISDSDRRTWRGRRVAAHLRACPECRAFKAAIDSRRASLRALAPPLPGVAAGAVLARMLARSAGGGHGGAAAPAASGALTSGGAAAGAHAGVAVTAKVLVGAALVAAAGAGTAHLALSGGGARKHTAVPVHRRAISTSTARHMHPGTPAAAGRGGTSAHGGASASPASRSHGRTRGGNGAGTAGSKASNAKGAVGPNFHAPPAFSGQGKSRRRGAGVAGASSGHRSRAAHRPPRRPAKETGHDHHEEASARRSGGGARERPRLGTGSRGAERGR